MKFDVDYCEDFERNGRRFRLRAIRPSDRKRLREGLQRLSPTSRYRRFFTDKRKFSDRELRYLTEPDTIHHFALVIGAVNAHDEVDDGVGVARFVELPDAPGVAEPAIVVVDDYQGQGFGRLLMERLVEAAVERGIRVFRSEVLSQNEPTLAFLASLAPEHERVVEGTITIVEFDLEATPDAGNEAHPVRRALRAVAAGKAAVQASLAAARALDD